jgi:hypothetical protein
VVFGFTFCAVLMIMVNKYFAASRNMTIISASFAGKEVHKQTWVSPDGMTSHEIERRWATNIMNIT